MKYLLSIGLFTIILIVMILFKNQQKSTSFQVGIIADCQYCDCETKGIRYYRKSKERLQNAVDTLNNHDLSYSIHLGDFIDQKFESFDTLNPIWKQLNNSSYHVLGNHDFQVADSLKPLIFDKMQLTDRYYSFVKNQWRFLILDGNDLSFHGSLDAQKQQETAALFESTQQAQKPYAQTWNGGLSKTQLDWIQHELQEATEKNQQVVLYCHFPVWPENPHNLWNSDEVLELISGYSCVKAYMNGHNHAGNYAEKNGIHFLTFKGMVDSSNTTSFAIASFKESFIEITGFGREQDKTLSLNTLKE